MQSPQMASRPLQLDQWSNTKAPINSAQRASVNRLAEWLHKNSAEYKQQQQQPELAATSTEQSVPTSDVVQRQKQPIKLPDARTPINTAQGFLAWYTSLTDSISSSTHLAHKQALHRISQTTANAEDLLAQLEQCQVNVSELRAGTAFVQDSSKGLRQEAQSLLESQLHLDNLSEEISSRLSFFTLLPYATSLLSSPDSSVVYTQEFLDLMDQLQVALDFLQQEPARTYKDAALYRMRYAQCVTRAATLAKLAVVRDFNTQAAQNATRVKELDAKQGASPKGKAKQISQDAIPISSEVLDILYTQFSEPLSTRVRPLVHELEKRASTDASTSTANTAAEFDSLLQECRLAWFTNRKPVLARLILSKMVEIETQAASHPDARYTATEELARSGAETLFWFLDKEVELYHTFFAASKDDDTRLKAYLGELAEALTSRLRLKVARETDPAILARVHTAILAAVQTGRSTSELLRSVMMETQTRLVSRAQAIIASEVGSYTPRQNSNDLDFPNRINVSKNRVFASLSTDSGVKGTHHRGKSGAGLLDAALLASSTPSSSRPKPDGSKVELFALPATIAVTYYTPVLSLLDLLYHLQTHVSARTFHDVAVAGIDACLGAVARGAAILVKQRSKAGEGMLAEDGNLFEIRQLEILREVVVSVDLVLRQAPTEQVDQDQATSSLVDLSSLIAAINSLWTNTGGRLLYSTENTQPSTDITMDKSTDAVNTRLQHCLDAVADLWATAIDFPLKVLATSDPNTVSAAKFQSTYEALLTCVESVAEEKANKITTWIEDDQVRAMLVDSISARVVDKYTEFVKLKPADASVSPVSAVQLTDRIRRTLLPPASS